MTPFYYSALQCAGFLTEVLSIHNGSTLTDGPEALNRWNAVHPVFLRYYGQFKVKVHLCEKGFNASFEYGNFIFSILLAELTVLENFRTSF
jgi:hypothetical protein